MKKVRVSLLFLVALTVIFLTGCIEDLPFLDGAAVPVEDAAEVEAAALEMAALVSYIIEADGIQISIRPATDALLSGYAEYLDLSEFIDGDLRIAFTANVMVRNFSILELGYEDGEFYAERALIAQKQLLPDRPLIVTWPEQGDVPHRGISFVDEDGETRYFTLRINYGEVGADMFVLLEF